MGQEEVFSETAAKWTVQESSSYKKTDKPARSVSLGVFVLTIGCLVAITIALGLGLGLGLGLDPGNESTRKAQDVSVTSLVRTKFHEVAKESFKYSKFYEIENDLPTVADDSFTNQTELDLITGFTISSDTRIRKYRFDITQALAAPDGRLYSARSY